MPTTDNMRVVIKKSNYVITYTTAWDDSEFLTVAMTTSAIAGGHARILDLTLTSANVSGNQGIECVRFKTVINTDIGTGEDAWYAGAAIYAKLEVTATGAVGVAWLYGMRLAVEMNASATIAGPVAGFALDIKMNGTPGDSVYAMYINNSGTWGSNNMRTFAVVGLYEYLFDFAQTGMHVTTSGDITGGAHAKEGYIRCEVTGLLRYIQLYT